VKKQLREWAVTRRGEGAGCSSFLLRILHGSSWNEFCVYGSRVNMRLHFACVLACILNTFLRCFITLYLVNKISGRAERSCYNLFFAFKFKDANTEATESAPWQQQVTVKLWKEETLKMAEYRVYREQIRMKTSVLSFLEKRATQTLSVKGFT